MRLLKTEGYHRNVRLLRTAAAATTLLAGLLSLPSAGRAEINARIQMALGNPDGANEKDPQRLLMQRPQFALSYNDRLRYPNWVSWHLSRTDVGNLPRGQFQPDKSLPRGFTLVTPSDYSQSGYDRGHNCPSADRSRKKPDNDAVFLMTNITPQAHGMNAGPWENLESYCRTLAKAGNELYIVCGHGFSSAKRKTIGKAKVVVPDFGWKVVVVLPNRSGDDLKRIDSATRVIAVRMPNINTIGREEWPRYITTPAEIERATGVKLFTALPPLLADTLRQKRDAGPAAARTTSSARTAARAPGEVWVNTKSGVYWRPGTEFYGKTKEGKYMKEADARRSGYRPAGGK